MTLDLVTNWTQAGEAELAEVVELRRAIHADPEVGLDCPRTSVPYFCAATCTRCR